MYAGWFFRRAFFFFKQKTAYEMRISDWSSDVCSSDLALANLVGPLVDGVLHHDIRREGAAQRGADRGGQTHHRGQIGYLENVEGEREGGAGDRKSVV